MLAISLRALSIKTSSGSSDRSAFTTSSAAEVDEIACFPIKSLKGVVVVYGMFMA